MLKAQKGAARKENSIKSIKKPNINDAPWKILFSALFLSVLGLVALNSISYQSTSLALNPFYKQLLFLFIALVGFLISF